MTSLFRIDRPIGRVLIDANALDRLGGERDALVDRFLALRAAGRLDVHASGGVHAEIDHPRTPAAVKEAFGPGHIGRRPPLTREQKLGRIRVRAILRGDAVADKHEADAAHLSEAAETGCSTFITHDKRILRKREDLRAVLPRTLSIVTLARFFEILDDVGGRRQD